LFDRGAADKRQQNRTDPESESEIRSSKVEINPKPKSENTVVVLGQGFLSLILNLMASQASADISRNVGCVPKSNGLTKKRTGAQLVKPCSRPVFRRISQHRRKRRELVFLPNPSQTSNPSVIGILMPHYEVGQRVFSTIPLGGAPLDRLFLGPL